MSVTNGFSLFCSLSRHNIEEFHFSATDPVQQWTRTGYIRHHGHPSAIFKLQNYTTRPTDKSFPAGVTNVVWQNPSGINVGQGNETKRNENGSEESEKEAISKDPIHRKVRWKPYRAVDTRDSITSYDTWIECQSSSTPALDLHANKDNITSTFHTYHSTRIAH